MKQSNASDIDDGRTRARGLRDLLAWVALDYQLAAILEPTERGAQSRRWGVVYAGHLLLNPEAQQYLGAQRSGSVDPKGLTLKQATAAAEKGAVPPTFLGPDPPLLRKPWLVLAQELQRLSELAPTRLIGDNPVPMPDVTLI